MQPHLRHSGVLGDENLRRFVSDFSQESLEEIAYKLKENFFLLIEEHIKYNFLILVPFKKHAKDLWIIKQFKILRSFSAALYTGSVILAIKREKWKYIDIFNLKQNTFHST